MNTFGFAAHYDLPQFLDNSKLASHDSWITKLAHVTISPKLLVPAT